MPLKYLRYRCFTFPHPSRVEHELFGGYHLGSHAGPIDVRRNRRPVFGACVRLFRLRFVFHRRAESCFLADTSVEPTSGARVSPRSYTSSHAASGVVTPAVWCGSAHLASSSRAAAPCSRARVYPGKKGCGGFFFSAARRVVLLSSPAVGVSVGDEQHRDAAAAMAMTKSAETAA
jgi:hypothetical protein